MLRQLVITAALVCGPIAHAQVVPLVNNCTDRGGTIVAGGTAQIAAPLNGYRQTFTIRNPSTAAEPLYFSVTGTASTASFDLPAGSAFSWPAGTTYRGAISVFAATTGHPYSMVECW